MFTFFRFLGSPEFAQSRISEGGNALECQGGIRIGPPCRRPESCPNLCRETLFRDDLGLSIHFWPLL